jgi:peroxiredoxin
VELQSRVDALKRQGMGVAAISYDSREVLGAFSAKYGITFPLLSDPGSRTIERYGILNTVVAEALGPQGHTPDVERDMKQYVAPRVNRHMEGIPFPGTFILDRSGRVTARFFEDTYVERDTVGNILMRLGAGRGTVQGSRVTGPHLNVVTYPSDAIVAPGNRFSLTVNVTPKAGIHVYAPGAAGYRVIALRMAPQPFLRVLPLTYPASQIYFFKPLNERVPVYDKPFTLVQDVMIEATPAAEQALSGRRSLTVAGSLDYQACNDRLCFNPVSVPLSWTLAVRPLVHERPIDHD